MAQYVRGQCGLPLRQVSGGGRGQPGPQRLRPGTPRAAVGVMPLAGKQRRAVPGVVIAEQAAHVGDEPAQRPPASLISGTIRSRGPEPRAPLPCRMWSLPNRPSSHFTSARSRQRASFTRSPTSAISLAAA